PAARGDQGIARWGRGNRAVVRGLSRHQSISAQVGVLHERAGGGDRGVRRAHRTPRKREQRGTELEASRKEGERGKGEGGRVRRVAARAALVACLALPSSLFPLPLLAQRPNYQQQM